jgi:hypothetical protein
LMTGACAGAASGAGIRFSNAGACGAGDPRRVVGLRTKPPRFANPPPCPSPPRAKPGVEARTQAVANTAAKTRFMIVTPICARPPRRPSCNQPRTTTFNRACFALTALAFIRTSNRMDEPNSRHRVEQNRLIGEIDRAAKGRLTRECEPVALRVDLELSRTEKRSLGREVVSTRCCRTRSSTGTRGLHLQSR